MRYTWLLCLASCIALESDPPVTEAGAAPLDGAMPAANGDAARSDAAGGDAAAVQADAAPHTGDSSVSTLVDAAGSAPDGGTPGVCVPDQPCSPEACKVGKTVCNGGTASCVGVGNAADGSACNFQNTCSSGHCCPSWFPTWDGNRCWITCPAPQRECFGECFTDEQPCNGYCVAGRVNCDGKCIVGDCCDDLRCGTCKKCTNHKCQLQTASEDIKQECPEGPCDTGACDGNGACGHLAKGTLYCEVTRLITCNGDETFREMQCGGLCSPSCKPTDSSCRGVATCDKP